MFSITFFLEYLVVHQHFLHFTTNRRKIRSRQCTSITTAPVLVRSPEIQVELPHPGVPRVYTFTILARKHITLFPIFTLSLNRYLFIHLFQWYLEIMFVSLYKMSGCSGILKASNVLMSFSSLRSFLPRSSVSLHSRTTYMLRRGYSISLGTQIRFHQTQEMQFVSL